MGPLPATRGERFACGPRPHLYIFAGSKRFAQSSVRLEAFSAMSLKMPEFSTALELGVVHPIVAFAGARLWSAPGWICRGPAGRPAFRRSGIPIPLMTDSPYPGPPVRFPSSGARIIRFPGGAGAQCG